MPFDLQRVREQLPGRRIEWFESIDSTMTAAARLAREDCPSGTVVGAEEQTAGVGRHGHRWHSEPQAGLYVSLVLRLPLGAEALPLVMLALGLATQEAIARATGLAADLRWPNDVLLGGRKCAGILAHLEGGTVIAGIGINVSHMRFPPEIEHFATSLRLEGAAAVSREELLVALIRAVDDCCRILTKEGATAILKMFHRASSYAQGRRVRIEQEGATIEGVTCGLDPSGFLRLREENGKETTILAGGVRPV
jgi:BirA family biotin operon repressor/biotin-[acetyl-CoA-carboxylase] ligase